MSDDTVAEDRPSSAPADAIDAPAEPHPSRAPEQAGQVEDAGATPAADAVPEHEPAAATDAPAEPHPSRAPEQAGKEDDATTKADAPAAAEPEAEAKADTPVAAEPEAEPPPPPEEEEPAPVPPPTIDALSPSHGPLAGGATLLITGSGFAEGCEVTIDGVHAEVERDGDGHLSLTTPKGAAKGEVAVIVKNPDGQLAAEEYRYDPPPSIKGIEPATVPVRGGPVLTILGAELAEGAIVLIDGAAVPVARPSATRLEAVASPHDAGHVDVVVKNPDGQLAVLEQGLRYAEPPFISGVAPARGVTTGGFEVTIAGQGFEEGAAVLFDGKPVAEVEFLSQAALLVRAPGHAAGSVEVTVVNPTALSHRAPSAFTYENAPPRIGVVSPRSGPNTGGTKLTVSGTDFDADCAVFVCGIAAKVTWKSREEIEVVAPPVARDGTVDLRIVNADDQADVFERAFRYDAPLPPPQLAAVTPESGSQVGGTKLIVTGDDFAEGAKVRVGGNEAETRFVTKKQLEATAPANAGAGAVDVEVWNPDGAFATLEGAFTYLARPAPMISSVSPPNGPTTGGVKIVIEGQNFSKDCQVWVGREYPKDIVVKSATEIHAVVPPRKTPGVVDVEVGAPGAARAVATNAFRYDAVPAPLITSVAPNAGTVAGGTELTIAGKNFRKDTAVLIDGKAPKVVKFIDAQTLECKTPPGEAGKMVDVAVRNPDGKEAVQKRAFLYDPRYRG